MKATSHSQKVPKKFSGLVNVRSAGWVPGDQPFGGRRPASLERLAGLVTGYRRRVPQVRAITAEELDRIPEVDVSEEGAGTYVQHGSDLERVARPHRRSVRSAEEWSPDILRWQGFVRSGGAAFGAFEAGALVGFAVLRVGLTDDSAQLASLYVDREWRRHGLASQLVEAVVDSARASGARDLYVSAAPSDSAVPFYLSRGFEPLREPHQELFELEPDDIHMSKVL
jgi:GNAT superfamily N-acetyltransferase